MKILFIGESWLGSCARSLKEALARQPGIVLDEVNEDFYFPKHSARWLRAINRILSHAYRQEFYRQTLHRVEVFKPDIVMTYKGYSIEAGFIRQMQVLGCVVVNVYPDLSPHAHGIGHKQAVGVYDLVVSTKPFHPALWKSVYGYSNRCVFVPQGYDPAFHLVTSPPNDPRFDITMVATWRPEYGKLMKTVGELLSGQGISVGIGGHGWMEHREDYPAEWVFAGAVEGRAYVDWLRQGRICLAPLTRDVVIAGKQQPGDEDTTRTYELASAHCFFIHRRTEYVSTIYDEHSEAPLFDDADDLVRLIHYYLPKEELRFKMAESAHARAVPAYSIDNRAKQIVALLA